MYALYAWMRGARGEGRGWNRHLIGSVSQTLARLARLAVRLSGVRKVLLRLDDADALTVLGRVWPQEREAGQSLWGRIAARIAARSEAPTHARRDARLAAQRIRGNGIGQTRDCILSALRPVQVQVLQMVHSFAVGCNARRGRGWGAPQPKTVPMESRRRQLAIAIAANANEQWNQSKERTQPAPPHPTHSPLLPLPAPTATARLWPARILPAAAATATALA